MLEVLDGRRPVAQVRPLTAAPVFAALETLARTAHRGAALGPAQLTKIGVAPAGPKTAEVYGTYQRGRRVFAVAARVALHRTGWQLTAFRVL